jgi:hypothetical protein
LCARAAIGVWAFFADLDRKRAQMEFARVGDSVAGNVLASGGAGHKARECKVALKRRC